MAIIGIDLGTSNSAAAVLRLRGKGLPEFGGDGTGDLYVRIQLQVPQQLSPQEQALYRQLRALASGSR